MAGLVKQELLHVWLEGVEKVIVAAPPRKDEQGLLAASLQVLYSLPCVESLCLQGWDASWANINALGELPDCSGELHLQLRTCGAATRVALASTYIPSTYSTWVIDQTGLMRDDCTAFLEAAPQYRASMPLLTIKVTGGDVSWVEDVAKRMAQEGNYPQVTVLAE